MAEDIRKKLLLYRTSTSGAVATDLSQGELALNLNQETPFIMFNDAEGNLQKVGALSSTTGTSEFHTMTQKAITDALAAEKARAEGAEKANADAIAAEAQTARAAEQANAAAIAEETNRAKVAEGTLATAISGLTDLIADLDSTVSAATDNLSVTVSQKSGKITGVTVSGVKLSDTYEAVTYPEISLVDFEAITAGETMDSAIHKIEQNVATLVDETLKNEEVTAAALTKVKESTGLDINLNYVANANATYIKDATSLSDADNKLDAAIAAEKARATAAESDLTAAIAEETNRAKVAEQANAADIEAEAERAKGVEKALGERIDNLDSSAKSYTIVKVENAGENVKEAFQLQQTIGETSTNVGEIIKIYKDSSLEKVELVGQELQFTYNLANGETETVGVDVSKFLAESEFKAGLQVSNAGEVSVKIDAQSESFLTVSEDGVKLSGVQAAINVELYLADVDVKSLDEKIDALVGKGGTVASQIEAAIQELDATVESSGANDYVKVKVEQVDGVITSVVVTNNDIDCGTF